MGIRDIEKMETMGDFEIMERIAGHEQVLICNRPEVGLRAIISIHDTTFGPALGGTRMQMYNSFDEALDDSLKLSRGMTYKCIGADVDFGGGKGVIIGNPKTDRKPELFRAYGQMVDSLHKRFYTGTDMGTEIGDFTHALKETRQIAGKPPEFHGGGDSSEPTALGVIYGIEAANKELYGTRDIASRTYAVQGLGKVGFKVAEHLLARGAKIFAADINRDSVKAIADRADALDGEVEFVPLEDIYTVDADVFVPCAIGGVINDETLKDFRMQAIVGSANNVLASDAHGEIVHERGILYAPDYIVNSGGLIQVADELYGANPDRVMAKTRNIGHSLERIFDISKEKNIGTFRAADEMCEQKLELRRKMDSMFSAEGRPKWDFDN